MSVKIHPSSIVENGAKISDGVVIGPFCYVGAEVEIGSGTVLESFVRVHDLVTIGENCKICEHTTIGGDPQDHGFKNERSYVRIGNNNLIRENVTISRATGEDCETVVGDDCFIMEGVHLAHNVKIGNHVTIANKVGLSGFVEVGDHVVFGGMAGVHQFVRIGAFSMIGGLFRVVKDVPPFTLSGGVPFRLLGLNNVGLRREGFSSEKRREIYNFYRDLYRRDELFTKNLERVIQNRDNYSPEIQQIIDFYKASKRGVTFWGRAGLNNA